MQKRSIDEERPLMSTIIGIKAISDLGTVQTKEVINEAFGKFDYVVKHFSRFDKSSELSQLNNAPKNKPIKISRELFSLVEYALNLSKDTDGAYDPTVLDLLELYGYVKNTDFTQLNNPELFKEVTTLAKTRHKPQEIVLNNKDKTVTLMPGQKLDLGSLGKGYAIDLAYDVLDKNFESFLINAGGDFRAKGKKSDGSPWVISLAKEPMPNLAEQEGTYGQIELNNRALAASGRVARSKGFFHHLIDPRTGLPVNHTHQCFVIANTAMEADALATALFVLGQQGLTSKISRYRPSIKALLIDAEGNRLYNL